MNLEQLTDNLREYEIKALEALELGLMKSLGKVAVERAKQTGYLANIKSGYDYADETRQDMVLKISDNDLEVRVNI